MLEQRIDEGMLQSYYLTLGIRILLNKEKFNKSILVGYSVYTIPFSKIFRQRVWQIIVSIDTYTGTEGKEFCNPLLCCLNDISPKK